MISGIFHQGSGLGNQLHRYVFTRCKALDLGVSFGMVGVENFKGKDMFSLDMGKHPKWSKEFYEQRVNAEDGTDIRSFDPLTLAITGGTLVDGEFQDEAYWKKYEKKVRTWLHISPINFSPHQCTINYRGGEYKGFPELYLTEDYWHDAVRIMKNVDKHMMFRVVTDDMEEAKRVFPDFPVSHDMVDDWRSIRYSPYLILSNSSFAIFPAWLNVNAKKIIAPKYWARRNRGFWALPQNKYSRFTYI